MLLQRLLLYFLTGVTIPLFPSLKKSLLPFLALTQYTLRALAADERERDLLLRERERERAIYLNLKINFKKKNLKEMSETPVEKKDCVVCYKENCDDFIPCERCKNIICIECASNMAKISGFFCPACKSGKPTGQQQAFVANEEEESERTALFQQLRDAFDAYTLMNESRILIFPFIEFSRNQPHDDNPNNDEQDN